MGDGVYGAQATSNYFFHKNASNLSKGEAALIAAVLPNPRRFSVARPTGYILKRQGWIIHQMALWGGPIQFEEPEEKDSRKKK